MPEAMMEFVDGYRSPNSSNIFKAMATHAVENNN
jgi:hypothetical protein